MKNLRDEGPAELISAHEAILKNESPIGIDCAEDVSRLRYDSSMPEVWTAILKEAQQYRAGKDLETNMGLVVNSVLNAVWMARKKTAYVPLTSTPKIHLKELKLMAKQTSDLISTISSGYEMGTIGAYAIGRAADRMWFDHFDPLSEEEVTALDGGMIESLYSKDRNELFGSENFMDTSDKPWESRSQIEKFGWWAHHARCLSMAEALEQMRRTIDFYINIKNRPKKMFRGNLIPCLAGAFEEIAGKRLVGHIGVISSVILGYEIDRDGVNKYLE
jgi:hypothetical protein